ncbi:MAG: carboxypeptidase regulatory-like domain-containing protein [Bacteroidota bacterium]|nr:carboxypeptidase regulatory-like domain-containing protein [Bacteroidota bacterium]
MYAKPTFLLVIVCLLGLASFAGSGDKQKKDIGELLVTVFAGETGKPLKEVSVLVYSSTRLEKTISTNMNGSFSFTDLKPGLYKLVFRKEGFIKVVRDKVLLKANEDFQLTIQMYGQEDVFDMMPSPLRFTTPL